MDENQRERIRPAAEEKNRQDIKAKKDSFSVVTTAQLILFLILSVVIAAVSKTNTQTSDLLKSDFNNLMSWKIVENAGDALSAVKEFLNEPFTLLPAFSPVQKEESEVTEASDTESTLPSEESLTQTEDESQTETESTDETTSADEASSTENMGGEDIEVYKAADNTSFSPVATTCAVVRPVDSTRYTSYFGYRINPITNERAFHTGLDIAAPLGTKIRAAYSGTVRKTGEDSHSGKYIFLTHDDGFETFYCHCSEILAEEGAVIRQGETIAKVGSTGWSTGPHLHFEIRRNGIRLNPLEVLENADG